MFHNLSGPVVPLHPEWAPGVSLASVHTSQDPVHPVLRQSGDSASAKLGHVPFDFKFVPPLTYFSTKIKKMNPQEALLKEELHGTVALVG